MSHLKKTFTVAALTATLLGGCSASEERESNVLEHSTTQPNTPPGIHDGLETEKEAWEQLLDDVDAHLHRTDLEGMNLLTATETIEVIRVGRIDVIDEATAEIKIALNDGPENCHTSTGTEVLTLGGVNYQGTTYSVGSITESGGAANSHHTNQCQDGDLVLLLAAPMPTTPNTPSSV